MEKPRTLLKTVPATELRLPISSIPENGIGENTHLQSDVKLVTKALSLKRSYRPQYREQAFRADVLLIKNLNEDQLNSKMKKQYFMQNTRMLEKEPVKTNAFLIPIN